MKKLILIVALFVTGCVSQYKVDEVRDDMRQTNIELLDYEKKIKENRRIHAFILTQLNRDKVNWEETPFLDVDSKIKSLKDLRIVISSKIKQIKNKNSQMNQSLGRSKIINKEDDNFIVIKNYKKSLYEQISEVDALFEKYDNLNMQLNQLLNHKKLSAVKQSMALKFFDEESN